MSETPGFPLLPVDRRLLARQERYREYVPPPANPAPFDPPMAASVAAARTLRRYMWRRTPVRAVTRSRPVDRRPALLDRWPRRVTAATSLGLATGLLAIELLVLLACRPDLHPRVGRRLVVTPDEIRRALAVSRTVPTAARVLARGLARRVTAEGGWIR